MKVGDFWKQEHDEQSKWIRDSIVQQVQDDMSKRSAIGIVKYGKTLDRTDMTSKEWATMAYEEALDLALYLKRLINEL